VYAEVWRKRRSRVGIAGTIAWGETASTNPDGFLPAFSTRDYGLAGC